MSDLIYDYWIYQKAEPKRIHLANYLSNAVPPAVCTKLNLNSYFDEPRGSAGVFVVISVVEAPIPRESGIAAQKHVVDIYVEPESV